VRVILGALRRLVPLLPARARRFLTIYVVVTSLLALLDIAALSLLALSLGAMAVGRPISLPLIGTVPISGYPWVLLTVSLLVIAKSAAAVGMQWVATRSFAAYELEIGDRLFDAYIRAPWVDRLSRTTAQLVRMADVGIANTTAGFLLPVISMPALIVTALSILLVLLIAQPITAVVTIVYLGIIAVILYFWLSRKSVEAGRVNRDYSMRVASLMTEMVGALKEITLRDKAAEVAAVVRGNRVHTTRARSNISFLGIVPRFILDAALVGGFLLVGGAAYLAGGLTAAFAAIALFGVAGVRLVPSLTSFQGMLSQVLSNVPHVNAVIGDIHAAADYLASTEHIGQAPLRSAPRLLHLRDVTFTYPRATQPAIRSIDLDLPMGSTLALVGSSGAGKSTLVDILLGLLEPSSGSIDVDGQPLRDVLAAWRARVGYVPQDVALFDGTVAQNVALAWGTEIDGDRVESALRRAQLWDLVSSRPDGVDGRIGERGMALSGGQRQRLGIARALYSDPLVLVMDEATSALDTKTESDVGQAIRRLRGELTIVSVAHRLATIRDSDLVCYMADGRIVARGRFDEVVRAVPEFAEQAALAGLTS
jgi:ATP-binding cassette subfamily C protein